ncbi:MAG: ABC transporter permease [Lachnospiraceae bacterium]|nr:ABC transporter permease [Lachnospiraceae bacterium]
MSFLDLLTMSASNLWRRKLRTCLTILGVIIGTTSIVVMLSLGFGLKRSYLKQVESSGGLTTVNVYSGNDYYYWGDEDSSSTEKIELTDEVIDEISQMEHVKFVSPILNAELILKQGVYQCYANVKAMSYDALEKMNIPLEYGSIPTSDEEVRFIFGNNIITDFSNTKTNEYYWDTGELPDVDLKGDFFAIYDTDAYFSSMWGDSEGNKVQAPKKYIVSNTSLVSGGVDEYNEYSYNIYANIDAMKKQLKKVFKNKAIPGQPTTKSGKPYSYWVYNEAYVQVDDFNYVTDVQKAISDMGLQAHSNAEYVESTQKQFSTIQMALGGIGSVALIVAAISIANTMMMSIYERTKEIGIIKVLGCSLGNIRSLFLMEAAFIGFIGGFLGLILSYGLSAVLNKVLARYAGDMFGTGSSVGISYIPLWLSGLALIFAIFVGIIAGFLPAIRAMKLSPLSAIKTE